MKDTIKVIIKHPNQVVGEYKAIDNTLEALQKVVGGYIELISVQSDPEVLLICNEEGKLQGLSHNFIITEKDTLKDLIVGPAIICGADGEDFGDVPITLDEWHKILWDWGN
ncbi:MAG: DUF3846 domain-containing protein [Clostridiales bacterium]|nr:DUF3846 domain-containing protein [Clostridiales bacterium]